MAPASPLKNLARTVGPWVIAALALTWVFHSVRWHELAEAFTRARWLLPFLAFSVVMLILNCAADSLAMMFTFRWFGCRIPYRELYTVRAATYLLAVIQYYVGQAAIIGFLRSRRGIPTWRAAGFILFISGVNMMVLMLLTALGLALGETPVAWMKLVPLVVAGGALAYAGILVWRPRLLAGRTLLAPLFEMGVRGHLKAIAVRMPHVIVLIIWHYFGLRCFRVDVPFLIALVYLPAVFFIAALPVSPQGLGLSQGVAVAFFARYAEGGEQTAVLAYSLALTGISLVFLVAMGLVFLPAARRLGFHGGEESAAPKPELAERGLRTSDG